MSSTHTPHVLSWAACIQSSHQLRSELPSAAAVLVRRLQAWQPFPPQDEIFNQFDHATMRPPINSTMGPQVEELMDQEVQHLSGGELQRVAITMALGMPADIYLIDEPSAYLDSEQRIIAAKVRARVHDSVSAYGQAARRRQLPYRSCAGARHVRVSAGLHCQTDSLRGAAGHQAVHHAQQEGVLISASFDSTPITLATPYSFCYHHGCCHLICRTIHRTCSMPQSQYR